MKILVAEDEKLNRKLIIYLLEQDGHHVQTVPNDGDERKLTIVSTKESFNYVTDIQKFIADTSEDTEFQDAMLKMFLNKIQERYDRLKKAIKAKDVKKIAVASHSVTNALGGIGLFSVSEISKNLETAAKT